MENDAFEAAVLAQCAFFTDCFARGDLAALVAHYYTDDAGMLAPAAPVLRGREAIRGGLASLRELGFATASLEPLHLGVEQSLGYEIGRVRLTSTAAGAPAAQTARYLVVWCKRNDTWRVQWDMFAMDEI
jgi:ketosteroid isomerase-like protein